MPPSELTEEEPDHRLKPEVKTFKSIASFFHSHQSLSRLAIKGFLKADLHGTIFAYDCRM